MRWKWLHKTWWKLARQKVWVSLIFLNKTNESNIVSTQMLSLRFLSLGLSEQRRCWGNVKLLLHFIISLLLLTCSYGFLELWKSAYHLNLSAFSYLRNRLAWGLEKMNRSPFAFWTIVSLNRYLRDMNGWLISFSCQSSLTSIWLFYIICPVALILCSFACFKIFLQ